MHPEELEQHFEKQISDNDSMILKVCRMYAFTAADREDLYQEIVLQLWKSFPNFRGESQFSTWLYRIAINTAITGLQKKSRQIPTDYIEEIQNAEFTGSVGQENEQWQQLHLAIEKLNDIEKAIVMLYLEDFSYDQMETILGINEGNLRVKMNRIKLKLIKLTNHS